MKRSRKGLAVAAFLLWEAYWAYAFFTAPVPDERMDTVFAILMGVWLPLIAGLVLLGVRVLQRVWRSGR